MGAGKGWYLHLQQQPYQGQTSLGVGSDDIIGKRPIDLVTKDESSRVGALLEHAMAEKAPITALEKEAKHKDGHSVFLEMNGFPLFDASGKFLGYRGIDRDITGRKRSKEAIDRAGACPRIDGDNPGP